MNGTTRLWLCVPVIVVARDATAITAFALSWAPEGSVLACLKM